MKNHFFEKFLEYLKEETLPGVWSKGVQMSRAAASIELVAKPAEESAGGEWKFKIKTTERLLAYAVTIWPGDDDSHCNCGSKIEPCHHIVAVALAYHNGLVSAPSESEAAQRPRLVYFWKITEESDKKGRIEFIREFKSGDELIPITTTLIGLMGGVQSGRIKSPLPPTTPLDLKIDEIISKPILRWNELFSTVAELPALPVVGLSSVSELAPLKEIQIRRSSELATLLIDRLDQTFVFRQKQAGQTPLCTFQEGLALFRNEANPTQGELAIQTQRSSAQIPKPILVTDTEALELFLRETLPQLREHYELEIRANDFPELVEVEPELDFRVHSLKNGTVSVTGFIHYPLTPLTPTQRPQIAKRNLEAERALQKKLKNDYQLTLEQPATLTTEAAFQLRMRTNLRGLDNYLESAMQGLGNISLDQALVKPSEVLHLLRLKDQNAGNTQGAVATLAQNLRASFTQALDGLQVDSKFSTGLPEYLRDYQKQGVTWLREKASQKSGAILADDMGLGKTLQTLWAIPTPAIIIVPTSLTHNWMNEIKQFRPELTVNLFHGPDREFDENAEITLTTYGVLRQDAQKLISRPWASAVLDEAHLIRNPDTQAAIASFQITANFKLALTGTPIQNRTRDLWSLFQFIAPGLFASESELTPNLIAPFVLRRTKDEVLKELPPKTYVEHTIELSDRERASYESALAAAKKEIAERMSDNEELSPLTLFETLLRARQACDHVGLYDASRWQEPSSKLDALFDLMDEMLEGGHSVLVFSQWTRFLDRITDELHKRALNDSRFKWFRLDGQTANRSQVLENFQKAREPRIFLLSLHAGGVGLNLTQADQVIFCDPWWNPFVELQAEDRAYRMGQDKPVTIHRLLCADSIEGRIQALQRDKLKLGNALILKEDLDKLLDKSGNQRY